MPSKTLKLLTTLAAVAVAGTGAAVVQATSGPGGEDPNALGGRAAALPAAVDGAYARSLDVFKAPAAGLVPADVHAFADEPITKERFAPNARLARAIPAPEAAPTDTWYVLPADQSVCLYGGGSSTCVPLDRAGKDGINMAVFPKPEGHAVPNATLTKGAHTVLGVLPAGATGVTAVTNTGATFRAAVTGETYAIEVADGLTTELRYDRPDGSQYAVAFGR